MRAHNIFLGLSVLLFVFTVAAEPSEQAENQIQPLQFDDVFEMEFVSDPQPSPDGESIVFVRNWMDRQTDRRRMSLWIVQEDGENLQALLDMNINAYSPRWSPTGDRIAFIADGQIHMYWLESGRVSQITQLASSPSSVEWSPNGHWLAFSMFTAGSNTAPLQLPGQPAGADWAAPPKFIDSMNYRSDGAGYLPDGYRHLYVVPSAGGTAIQLTSGNFHHSGQLSWASESDRIFFSANRHEDWKSQPLNSEIFSIDVETQELQQITQRSGPDSSPKVSPDGRRIAFLGFDDQRLAYQQNKLYVMNIDGSDIEVLTGELDRSINDFAWKENSRELVVSYNSEGRGILANQTLRGRHTVLVNDLGGSAYSRPYLGGDFSVSDDGLLVYTQASTSRPAELAAVRRSGAETLTQFNDDLDMAREIADVEMFWYESTIDELPIQGWIMYPPGFDDTKKYPLILEIHGGPHAAYGDVFAMELQLMAAKGYVVLYTNPRGSTSYGMSFGNEIHHNYPSHDFQDLMDGVDAVIDRGFINEEELFITGGSGGGVLTTWSIAHTDRFAAAVAVNPVINWYSFVLNADLYNYFTQYWFPGFPWDIPEHYLKYSPISYVGQVNTPTLLFTGESDHRTPISETEQYYQALQLRGVESAMVRVPGASHALHVRPSQLMAKPAYVTYWFDRFRQQEDE
ncbi:MULTISPECIES: S9 family peptidase [Gammaproteobacteria]|uniref:S9 family peptidase n=1 Tax=Gammaproteobacteria TaxID=1236 RepID=UPI000DCFAD30|nr:MULTISPECIES: S9 family peptidase [Gammaproteobacteria]RTE86844.1 S9 family peptidase [Aliidiomarina sp. B3213]TCZ93367.1 S9 family peptidase [Lysobacter sp. N42]